MSRIKSDGTLTHLEQRFVVEYLVDLKGAAAARRAGYSAEGANVTASQLLRAPRVREAIERGMSGRALRTRIDADKALREVWGLCVADVRELLDEEGKPRPLNRLPRRITRAISSLKIRPDGTYEVRLWDKTKALELAMRHLGMLRDKLDVDMKVETYAELVAKSVLGGQTPAPSAGAPSAAVVEAER